MKQYLILIVFYLGLTLVSCEDDVKGPLVKETVIPEPPTVIQIENQPGAAKITYSIPDDEDLLYVMATFSSQNGEERTVKSSVFKNYVQLDGFGESKEYEITLCSVNRYENRSEPIKTVVNPLRAHVFDVYETLKVVSTFGGMNMKFLNESANEFTVFTLIKDSVDDRWIEYDRLYTSAKEQDYSVRGFEPKETDFAVYLMDKWKNKSDTLFKRLIPLYEVEFDKALWVDANLPDDSNIPRYEPLYQLWTPGAKTYFFMSPSMPGLTLPNWITIDLGKEYVFGRMHIDITNHADSWMYTKGTPQKFEIWGSNIPTTNWDEWTQLGEFEIIKPSGLPVGKVSAEDRAQAEAGFEFDFPFQSNSFRYIRFKTITTFAGVSDVNFRELSFWGQPIDSKN